jgi:hypothetical protein
VPSRSKIAALGNLVLHDPRHRINTQSPIIVQPLIVLLRFALEGFSFHPDLEEAARPVNQATVVP